MPDAMLTVIHSMHVWWLAKSNN